MDTTDQSMSGKTQRFDDMFNDAEDQLRRGMETLSGWSDQAREVFENRPGVVLSAIAIAGFMAGLMVRKGGKTSASEPLIVFATGAAAGLVLGQKVIEEMTRETHHSEML